MAGIHGIHLMAATKEQEQRREGEGETEKERERERPTQLLKVLPLPNLTISLQDMGLWGHSISESREDRALSMSCGSPWTSSSDLIVQVLLAPDTPPS
jgi:hypothetical protein